MSTSSDSSALAPINRQRLRSVPWGFRDALALFVLAWVIVPVTVYLWLAFASPFVPALQPLNDTLNSQTPQANLIIAIIDAIGSVVVLGYLLRRRKSGLRDLGLRGFSVWKAVLYIGGLFVAFLIAVQLLYLLIQVLTPSFDADQTQTTDFEGLGSNMQGWLLLVLVILPAFIEEAVFRGFVFPALSKRFGIVFGAITSSVLFGLAHVQPNVVVYTFVFGLILCFLYVRLGSIIPGIALHMFNNYIAFVAMSQN